MHDFAEKMDLSAGLLPYIVQWKHWSLDSELLLRFDKDAYFPQPSLTCSALEVGSSSISPSQMTVPKRNTKMMALFPIWIQHVQGRRYNLILKRQQ